jgi:hypothetical protein
MSLTLSSFLLLPVPGGGGGDFFLVSSRCAYSTASSNSPKKHVSTHRMSGYRDAQHSARHSQ